MVERGKLDLYSATLRRKKPIEQPLMLGSAA